MARAGNESAFGSPGGGELLALKVGRFFYQGLALRFYTVLAPRALLKFDRTTARQSAAADVLQAPKPHAGSSIRCSTNSRRRGARHYTHRQMPWHVPSAGRLLSSGIESGPGQRCADNHPKPALQPPIRVVLLVGMVAESSSKRRLPGKRRQRRQPQPQ